MFFFICEGRYVTAVNKFWFWISVVAGLLGVGMSFTLLQRAGQIPLGIIMALLFIGCVIFDCMFLIAFDRHYCMRIRNCCNDHSVHPAMHQSAE